MNPRSLFSHNSEIINAPSLAEWASLRSCPRVAALQRLDARTTWLGGGGDPRRRGRDRGGGNSWREDGGGRSVPGQARAMPVAERAALAEALASMPSGRGAHGNIPL